VFNLYVAFITDDLTPTRWQEYPLNLSSAHDRTPAIVIRFIGHDIEHVRTPWVDVVTSRVSLPQQNLTYYAAGRAASVNKSHDFTP
jgi:hypothetical protein